MSTGSCIELLVFFFLIRMAIFASKMEMTIKNTIFLSADMCDKVKPTKMPRRGKCKKRTVSTS